MSEKPSFNPEEESQKPPEIQTVPVPQQNPEELAAGQAHLQAVAEQAQNQGEADLAEVRKTISAMPDREEQNPDLPVDKNIQKLIHDLGENNHLIIHQTASDTADNILNANYFGINGLEGTALPASAEDIVRTFEQLDRNYRGQGAEYGTTHKNANAAVIMAIPRSVAENIASVRGRYSFSELDEYLSDLTAQGKLAQMGLPNSFIWGAYYNGDLKFNPNFAPSLENPPPANTESHQVRMSDAASAPDRSGHHPSGVDYNPDGNQAPEDLKIVQ